MENKKCDVCTNDLDENNKCVNVDCPMSEVYYENIPKPTLPFTDNDLEYLLRIAIYPLFAEYTKKLVAIQGDIYDNVYKGINEVTDVLADHIREVNIKRLKDTDFVKAVLYTHRLTDATRYREYITEWNKLNKEIIEK